MKIIKAKVYIDQDTGSTVYHYPDIWLKNKESIPAILYPQDRSDQGTDERGKFQIIYPVVPDDLATELLKLPEFSPANQKELEQYSLKHQPIKEVITDQSTVIKATLKLAKGQSLAQKEIDALDPDSPEPGIVKTKAWHVFVEEEYGAKC